MNVQGLLGPIMILFAILVVELVVVMLGWAFGHDRGYDEGTKDCEDAYFDEVAAENAKQVDQLMEDDDYDGRG
jgi:hypothetical protein